MKYRIIQEINGRYCVQHKYKYWPFWFHPEWNSHSTFEKAEIYLARLMSMKRKPVVIKNYDNPV